MKKISIIITIFALFGLFQTASADIVVNYNGTPSPHPFDLPFEIHSTNTVCAYRQATGTRIEDCFPEANVNYGNPNNPLADTVVFVECDVLTTSNSCDTQTLSAIRSDSGYLSEITLSWEADPTPPPAPAIVGGVFFGTNDETGDSKALDLLASAGNSTKMTTTNLLPVVAVVGGVILAFIGIRFIVSLLHDTSNNKNKTRV